MDFKTIAMLVVGFLLLIKGADFFVEGSAAVAKRLKVPSIIIGLTIVALGTSAPELAVSLTASINGANELAISNVVGSNLFNLLFICGLCGVISPLVVKKSIIQKEFPFAILTGIIMLGLGFINMNLGRIDGIILMVLFLLFIGYMIRTALKSKQSGEQEQDEDAKKPLPVFRSLVYIGLGLAAIIYGSDMVVDSASAIASALGLSQNLIGLTIVAMGTSLPELVTSVVATRKKQLDIAIGNVVGSNIFNILWIIGISSSISPMVVTMENVIDLIILAVVSVISYLYVLLDHTINRWEGTSMIIMYAGFLVYTCIR